MSGVQTFALQSSWTYVGNGAHDELTAGQTVSDHFTVVSQDSSASGTVTVTITGTNDARSEERRVGKESRGDTSAALNTSGLLTITDPDTGVVFVAAEGIVHGSVSGVQVCALRVWTYVGNGAHDELTAGQTVSDHFTVVSQDSSASGTVTVTITGTNDARSEERRVGKESRGDTSAALNTSGLLTITDPDTGVVFVAAEGIVHGSVSGVQVCALRVWTYVGNGAHDELTAGQTVSDHFTVVSQDGSASGTVTVTITGTNDAATVSSDSKARTEERPAGKVDSSGRLTVTDPDTGEAHVVAQTNGNGTYGDSSGDANGAWTYAGNGAHDELTAGQTVSDHFTVVSQDGSASGTVTVTITGTNDAATVSSDSKAVSEGDTSETGSANGWTPVTQRDTIQAPAGTQTN